MTTCHAVRPAGCPAGTTFGTTAVRHTVRPGVPCWVQNQNQNQNQTLSYLGLSSLIASVIKVKFRTAREGI